MSEQITPEPREPTAQELLAEIDQGLAALLRITDPMIAKTLGPHLGQCLQRLAAHLSPAQPEE